MRKYFGFGNQKGKSSLGSSTIQQGNGVDMVSESGNRVTLGPRYHIRDKDLGKIHKAASTGNVQKVQKILFLQENGLNDKDRKNRTALHLACANGHPEVVTFLADRKCRLNLCDNENRTALIKAVQCQEEECATILLKHGADPNIMDITGNTALHYAVVAQNMDMAAKLLSYKADIEASNKDELTPLLLAVNEKKHQMVEFLVKRNANVHAVDKMKRTSLMLAVNDSTSDIVRLLLQQGVDVFSQDNCGWTAEEHAFKRGLNFNYKLIHDYKVGEICKQLSQNRNQDTSLQESPKEVLRKTNSTTVSEHSEVDSESSLIKPDMDDSWPESDDEDFCFETKNVVNPSVTKLMSVVQQALKNIEEKYGTLRNVKETSLEDNEAHCENEDGSATFPKPSTAVQEEETKPAIGNEENDINIIESAPQEQTNNDNLICADGTHENDTNALGLRKKEDEESPWDSESFSASVPGNYIVYLPEAAEESGKNIPNGQVEDSSDWDSTDLPSNHETCQRTGDLKVDDKCPFVSQSMMPNQSASTDFGHMTLEDKEAMNIGAESLIGSPRFHDLRESQLPEKGESKEDFSAELGLGLTSEEKQERLHGSRKNHPWVIEERNDSQRQLSQEQNARISQDTILTKHLCKQKKIEINLKEMNSEVSESHEKEKRLLHKNHMLQDEIAMLRLEIDTAKNQNQEMEKKSLEDIATVKDKNDCHQKTIKLNEETLTKKMFQYTTQLNNLIAENTMLKSQLEDEKQNKERLETEIKSYCSKLATATHDHEQGQTSKEDLELSFQRARDEWFHLRDKMNFELSNLKGNNEILSQQLCKAESKLNSLETELHQTRDALRERTLVLECVQTDLSQTQCRKKEMEDKYQYEQDKVNKYTGKQKSLEERLSQLQSENALLQQQLYDADHKADSQEKALINMQEQFQDAIKRLKAESEKQGHMLQEKNQKLISECNYLKERMCRYELDKEEREVSESHEKEKCLLHENHMLQDEIAMLRLKIDTVKNQKQALEKKYLEDIAIVKDKNDCLQNTIKLYEETLTKKMFQYTAQLNILTTENTMLKSQLKDKKQNKERLETEIKSYCSKLATATHDHEQGQTSKEDLELSFQRVIDEWFHLWDKMNFDLSNLKENNEILSQQLCKAESKLNSLETELHQTRDALRERTLVLECVQTDLSQTQCRKKEMEDKYQHEQDKVNKYTGKQKSLEERLSQLQSENALLQQQLYDADHKADSQEKALINMQEQFQDAIKRLKAESEKQGHMLQEKNQKLISECNYLKERMCRYELDKEEREVVMRQLQQELADTLRKQSMSEVSLEVTACYHTNLGDETRDVKTKLDQIRSQVQEASNEHVKAIKCAEKMQDQMQKLEAECAKLKDTIKKQASRIEQLQRNPLGTSLSENEKEVLKQSLEYHLDEEKRKNGELEKEITRLKKLLKITGRKLNEYEKRELHFPGDLKPNHTEMDVPMTKLKQKITDSMVKLETLSSKCLRLEEENQFLRQQLLSLKGIQTKCDELKNKNKNLKGKLVILQNHIEMNMVEYSEVEQYKHESEERARQEIVKKLKEVDLFLQTQAASQENLPHLQKNDNASIRSHIELRTEDLESERSKVKPPQVDSNETDLEKHKQLYLKGLQVRTSLIQEINKANERLAEASTKLHVMEQQHKSFLSILNTRPVPESPCPATQSFMLNRNPAQRENLEISTSIPWTSNNSTEIYLFKMQRELEKNILKELKEAEAELEFESC